MAFADHAMSVVRGRVRVHPRRKGAAMSSRPNHFEIPVDDPDRAEKFYGTVFGWTFNRYEGAPQYYGLAATGDSNPGIDGALFQRTEGSATTITMGVDSIEDALEQIKAAGGSVVLGKTPI